jgi:hypothetical protein
LITSSIFVGCIELWGGSLARLLCPF